MKLIKSWGFLQILSLSLFIIFLYNAYYYSNVSKNEELAGSNGVFVVVAAVVFLWARKKRKSSKPSEHKH